MAQSESSYKLFSEANKTGIAAKQELAGTDKSLKETYSKFNTTLTEAQSAINADKANELLSSIIFLQNNSQNEYKSLPFQFTGEQSKLQLVITPREEKTLLQTYTTKVVFPLKRKQYTVIGMSFYGATLHDEAYSSIKSPLNDSVSVYGFIKEDFTKAEAGVTALIRFGTKINTDFNVGVHGSLGPGISLTSDKIRPRILIGGGFSFGKTHMAAVDLGAIAGSVNRLSTGVQTGDLYPEKPETVTVSRLGIGIFLSLGYIYKF